jgi:5-methyltetrahydrofolate--homocysteine methyltransferase
MILDDLAVALEKGDRNTVVKLTEQALADGMSAQEILNNGLIKGMGAVGLKFKNNEVFIPEVLISARAMNMAMKVLEPILVKDGVEPKGTVVLGTVKGDLHDIGKNLVGMMLKGSGYKVVDIGIDVPAEKFVSLAQENNANVVAMSALLTTTMGEMETVVNKFKETGVRSKVKMVIGGAPITQAFAEKIGADGYAPDAASAVDVVERLLKAS